jgi:hypothetical protein
MFVEHDDHLRSRRMVDSRESSGAVSGTKGKGRLRRMDFVPTARPADP